MLATYKAELERNRKKVEALEDVVKKLSPPDDYWKGKYEQLSGSIGYYDRYVRRLIDLYSSLAAGAAETRPGSISAILEDLERLAIRVKELANEFLEDNRAVTAGEFDPGVLDLPGEIAAEVEGAVDGRTADGSETGQSEETAIAGARAVLEKALAAYRDGGWEAVTPYMSPELLRAYNSAPVPWDQVSYTITGTDIQSETLTGADSATFGVLETLDELGEIYTESVEWQMLKSGGAWKVHNTIDGYGESKL